MVYLILAIGYIIDILFIVHDDAKHDGISILYKTLASLSFVILALYLVLKVNNSIQSRLILYALIADMFGDVALILRNVTNKKDLVFVIGTLFFFLGHIFLMVMLYINNPEVLLRSFAVTCVLFAGVWAFTMKMTIVKKSFMIIGAIYCFFILYMLTYSFFSYIDLNSAFNASFMFAYFLFAVSDIVLIIQKFGKTNIHALQPIYRLSYYISQVLIAMSIINL